MITSVLRKILGALFGDPENASRYAQYDGSAEKPVVLVTLLSADASTRDKAILTHSKKSSHLAVFVVTDSDVTFFQDRDCIVEHIPSPHAVHTYGRAGDWRGYLEERWRMLHLKWGPIWTLCYGRNFEDYLQDCGISGYTPE